MHSIRRTIFKPKLATIGEVETHSSHIFRDIKITRGNLEAYVKIYEETAKDSEEPNSLPAEILMIKNLVQRYPFENDRLAEWDIEILVCIIKLDLDHRNPDQAYLHESLFDDIIIAFKLEKFFDRTLFFNPQF